MTDSPEPGSTALAEVLHRATDALPPPALPGDLWIRGRRERRRRMARRAGAAVAAVVAAAVGLPTLGVVAPPTIGPAATTVSGYPMRINHQWVVRDLPARPGPLAALVKIETPDQPIEWRGVSPTGHQWRLPLDTFVDSYPALSSDGRYLGYLEPEGVHVRIADLVAGTSVRFSGFTDGASGPGITRPAEGWQYPGQSPVFFSPDGTRLAFGVTLLGPPRSGSDPVALAVADRTTGRVTLVPLPAGDARTVLGWSGPDSVWLAGWPSTVQAVVPPETVDSFRLTDLGLDGRVRSAETLRPREPAGSGSGTAPLKGIATEWLSQWTGPISPDGTRIALLPNGSDSAAGSAYNSAWMDRTGLLTTFDAQAAATCPALWTSDGLAVSRLIPLPEQGAGGLETSVFAGVGRREDTTGTRQHPIAEISPRVGARCVIWAGDAVAAGPTGWHPFGTSTARWTWYWPELTAAGLAAALAAAALAIRRRTRRRRIS